MELAKDWFAINTRLLDEDMWRMTVNYGGYADGAFLIIKDDSFVSRREMQQPTLANV